MSSDEEAVARFVNNGGNYFDEHSNNNALNAYINSRSHSKNNKYYDSYDDTSMGSSDDDNKINNKYNNNNNNISSSDDRDEISSIGTLNDDKSGNSFNRKALNIFNPKSPTKDEDIIATERHNLLQRDAAKEMHGRLLREKVMRNHKYYYSALRSIHIWCIVFVTSLDHLLRKYFEYFAYFICTQSLFIGISFYEISWSVAALDFAAIFASSFILPFVNGKSPHFVQFVCEIFIGMSMLFIVWWNSFIGLFVLRFIFGIGYILILSNWSACISTFVSPSKQSSAIGKIDLSWAFASFFFILCAYVMDNYNVNYIFYILSIIAILSSLILFSIMPSQKLIRTEIHSHNFLKQFISMLRLIFFQHLPTGIFLLVIGIITFVNSSLTLLLAPWLSNDYDLSITEFGYCTVIIGTAQVVAIIFSYQFGNKLGVGWSLLAGILVQFLMFILIFLLNNNGILYQYMFESSISSSSHYTFPLLLILLILSIHFIASEFTYINAVTCMLHIAPIHIISSKTIAANSMRFVTSICRILGAIFAPYFWYYSSETIFVYIYVAVILLAIAFVFHLGLMLYIACCVWDKNNRDEEYMMVSSNGDNNPNNGYYQSDTDSQQMSSHYMFEQDIDYPNIKNDDDEMDDEYIAKILSTNPDFTLI